MHFHLPGDILDIHAAYAPGVGASANAHVSSQYVSRKLPVYAGLIVVQQCTGFHSLILE